MRKWHALVLLSAFAAACSDDDPAGPTPAPMTLSETNGRIVAMSRNMYIGADVDRVIAALSGLSGEDPQVALTAVLQEFIATDLPTRLSALASEIAREQPHVVGLQEVATLGINLPAEFGFPPIQADFLAGLLQALALRGLSYHTVSNLNFTFSLLGGAIALEDRDVLLVSDALPLIDPAHGTYSCPPLCIPVNNLGTLSRGWVRATTRIGSRTVTFVSTHPESGDIPQIAMLRAGQMQELAGTLANMSGPVVLLGDLNDTPGSAALQVLASAGFLDTWPVAGTGDGNTCCHATSLQGGAFTKRIDYALVRGFLTGNGAVIPGAKATVIGESAAERVNSAFGAIWPSDHGGVVLSLPMAR
ncbi:MAG TPA: endonuclease/exonuclease/phosphatase family protein [Gemmatimonadales bacterium]|nr:endonuclease/exonuclease/phosphatase family protein [Gemmatimonadales bacterium]